MKKKTCFLIQFILIGARAKYLIKKKIKISYTVYFMQNNNKVNCIHTVLAIILKNI